MDEPFKVKPFAPWWVMFLARIFGEKFVSRDDGVTMTGYRWRGIIYVWSVAVDSRVAKP